MRPRTASAISPGCTAPDRSTRSSAPPGCGASSGACASETRLGIPAIVHEECLTGLAAWKAATFPTPLAWGASFDPDLVEEMGRAHRRLDAAARHPSGARPRARRHPRPALGARRRVHRRGPLRRRHDRHRVRARAAGCRASTPRSSTSSATPPRRPDATTRRFTSGRRELADVLLPPFEMAIRDGGARSVMNSYAAIDGVPVAAIGRAAHRHPARAVGLRRRRRRRLLRRRLPALDARRRRGSRRSGRARARRRHRRRTADGDAYHGTARGRGARRPGRRGPRRPCGAAGARRRRRSWACSTRPSIEPPTEVDLDSPAHREVARRLAEESIVLLSNDGILPLELARRHAIAVIGPNADCAGGTDGLLFVRQPRARAPPGGRRSASRSRAVRRRAARGAVGCRDRARAGCDVTATTRPASGEPSRRPARPTSRSSSSAIAPACSDAAPSARATTSKTSSCPASSADWSKRSWAPACRPSWSSSSGRPYAIGWAIDGPPLPPLSCRPSSPAKRAARRSPRSSRAAQPRPAGCRCRCPRSAGAQPYTYLHPILGGPSEITSADSTSGPPVRPRPDVHDVRAHPADGTVRVRDERSTSPSTVDVRQHRRARRSRRRAALRAGPVRERHASRRAAGGLCAGRPRGRRANRRPVRGAVGASRVHRSPRGPHRRAG